MWPATEREYIQNLYYKHNIYLSPPLFLSKKKNFMKISGSQMNPSEEEQSRDTRSRVSVPLTPADLLG